ncbi:MAG: HIRAN domain-containing protein [Nitrosomonas sp.]|nr:HIRAN domain-containing protein [Nitrosomonas sp.]
MMSRRVFLKSLTALLGGFSLPAIAYTKPDPAWKTLQISPVAGFQYYQGETLWPQLATGQFVTLVRETDNPYDDRAVRIEWQGHQLGYIPRMDNAAISQLIDRGEKVSALIVGLKKSNNPWDRVEVEIKWRA